MNDPAMAVQAQPDSKAAACSQSAPGAKALHWARNILIWVLSAALLLVGIGACNLAVYIGMNYTTAKPILLAPPQAAIRQLTDMMDAVSNGDYEKASTYLLGSPSLGVAEPSDNPLAMLMWEAFLDSTEYTLEGDCYTTEVGLAQNISYTYLDPTSVTVNLKERSQELLNQRVEEAEDVSEIYDENNEYKESVVMEVLREATQDALREDAQLVTISLTINLKYQDGTWWIVVDDMLLDAFSGGILY